MLSSNWSSVSPVQIYVQRACEPTLSEPNYALNLELADYINKKKANSPREAAMAIAHQINQRNPHVSILAISLLQTLVQAVGYPFHLQIATKEFLNELVRRFPERPPPFPGPVMTRILDLIHEWKETICKESRWREDLGNIRDMHRLLTYKGYRFRDVSKTTNLAAAANANLKSPDELEEEDREAQQAKLQELIRRGTPRDLAAAQELMKSLSGANPDSKPDYKKQTLHELEKLQSKVILLSDLLDNVDREKGERFAKGDAYDQVASICKQARPKIQKWISDAESDDPESLENFLSINDLLNNVLDRYERYQKGDFNDPPPDPTTSGPSSAQQKPNLIDFDMEEQPSAGGAPDDLAELFGPSVGTTQTTQPMSIPPSLFSTPPTSTTSSSAFGPFAQAQPISGFSGQSMMGTTTFGSSTPGGSSSSTFLGGIALPSTPNNPRSLSPAIAIQNNTPTPAGYQQQGFSSRGSGFAPTSQQQQQQQQPQQQQSQPNNGKGKDPFADLVGLF